MSLHVALNAAMSSEAGEDVTEIADRLLTLVTTDDRHALTLSVLAPQFAMIGNVELAERFHRLFTSYLQSGSVASLDPTLLANAGRMWYMLTLLNIHPPKHTRLWEDHAVEFLTEAERLAREHGELENHPYVAKSLGLIFAAQGRFGRARALLPSPIYAEITRSGGARLRDVIIDEFTDRRRWRA